MREIDLHMHTDISDGSESPENAVRYAKYKGLKAIAITDHDNVAGVKRAIEEGKKQGIEVIGGLELGCGYEGREVHMLAYGIDPDNEKLLKTLKWILEDRDLRNERMAANMEKDGIRVNLAEMKRLHSNSTIGRPHFAVRLVELGLAESVQDAFNRYLDPGQKYYLRRSFLTIEEAAEFIHEAGGKAVLAHPRQYRMNDERLRILLSRCKAAGVDGMECIYSGYDDEYKDYLKSLAAEFGFFITAGSDWHGKNKPHIEMAWGLNGEVEAGYELIRNIKDHETK